MAIAARATGNHHPAEAGIVAISGGYGEAREHWARRPAIDEGPRARFYPIAANWARGKGRRARSAGRRRRCRGGRDDRETKVLFSEIELGERQFQEAARPAPGDAHADNTRELSGVVTNGRCEIDELGPDLVARRGAGVRIAQILDERAVATALEPLRPGRGRALEEPPPVAAFTTPSASAKPIQALSGDRRLSWSKAARMAPASPAQMLRIEASSVRNSASRFRLDKPRSSRSASVRAKPGHLSGDELARLLAADQRGAGGEHSYQDEAEHAGPDRDLLSQSHLIFNGLEKRVCTAYQACSRKSGARPHALPYLARLPIADLKHSFRVNFVSAQPVGGGYVARLPTFLRLPCVPGAYPSLDYSEPFMPEIVG